ncbi:MAG: hypothetical protein ACOC4M_08155 [Promethearchaeia archaeon]
MIYKKLLPLIKYSACINCSDYVSDENKCIIEEKRDSDCYLFRFPVFHLGCVNWDDHEKKRDLIYNEYQVYEIIDYLFDVYDMEAHKRALLTIVRRNLNKELRFLLYSPVLLPHEDGGEKSLISSLIRRCLESVSRMHPTKVKSFLINLRKKYD